MKRTLAALAFTLTMVSGIHSEEIDSVSPYLFKNLNGLQVETIAFDTVDNDSIHMFLFIEHENTGQRLVKAMNWSPRNGWSTPVVISSLNRSASNITMASNQHSGHLVAAWAASDKTLGKTVIECVQLNPKERTWGSVQTVSLTTEDCSPENPILTLDKFDNIILMWASFNGSSAQIRTATGEFGAPLSKPISH